MDRLKRFIDCYIPTETCNFRCHYCYIVQQRKFNNVLAHFEKTPQEIRAALSKRRLGGVCIINFCAGGETLLSAEVVPIIRELLDEGHYLMVVTNGSLTKRFEEICQYPKELLKRLFFKFSFHYLELKRLNMMDRYFSNIKMVQNAGCSFTVELTPSDELVPFIDEIKAVCMERLGALCHVTIGRDDRTDGIEVLSNYTWDEYKKIWGQFDSELFRYKSSIFKVKQNDFCYAGDWSFYLNLMSGDVRQCYCGAFVDNIYRDISRPIKKSVIGSHCELAHCYNGHAFLAFGNIPGKDTTTFAEERNRVSVDGNEWLGTEVKDIFSQKLYENNHLYTPVEKKISEQQYQFQKVRRTLGQIKRAFIK